MTLRFGCQGWNYPAWVGPFYPPGTKAPAFLETYARVFNLVEIDSTWYATPPLKSVEKWIAATPPGFTFTPKLVREITHERHFVSCEDELARYLEVIRILGPRLGPILIQCPEVFTADGFPFLEEFLRGLPTDLRFAIEFRHTSWFNEETHQLLRDHRVAWTLTEARWVPRKWMLQLGPKPTADFTYMRWMGPDRAITDFSREQVDRTAQLELWAEMIGTLTGAVSTAYLLVNNHFEGHAPNSLRKLQRLLRVPTIEPEDLRPQLDFL